MNNLKDVSKIIFTYIGEFTEYIGKLIILGIYKIAVWVEKKLRPHV